MQATFQAFQQLRNGCVSRNVSSFSRTIAPSTPPRPCYPAEEKKVLPHETCEAVHDVRVLPYCVLHFTVLHSFWLKCVTYYSATAVQGRVGEVFDQGGNVIRLN